MRLYTGRGDHGATDLLGARVGKDDARIDLLGDLDETSAALGLARAHARREETRERLIAMQRDLYAIMAEIAFTDEVRPEGMALGAERVAWLERETDALSERVTLPRAFVLPGESLPGATLDLARTVARRGERAAVALHRAGHVGNEEILRYLNRLSSLLFMLARAEDAAAGGDVRLAKTGEKP